MNRFHLSKEADRDLENIWVYLADHDEIAADRVVAQILNRLPMLAQFPGMGKARNELLNGLRSFPSRPYFIFYIQQPDQIEILRIIQQSRDLEQFFQ
jgi:toxin ParE1/3/4